MGSTKTERCLFLLAHLHRHGRIATAEAARLLGVTPRAAAEDLRTIRGVVLLHEVGAGRNIAWELDPSQEVKGLTLLDQISLLVGRQVTDFLAGTALHDGLRRAGEERARNLPRRYAAHFDRKIRHLSEPARSYADHGATLDEVLDALLRERTLSFTYDGRSGAETLKDREPLTLVIYRRALYVLATDPEGVRAFAVERIRDARVGEGFPYPDDWRPDEWLGRSFGIAPDGAPRDVVLRFTEHAARFVRARTWHRSQVLVDLPNGGVELRMQTTGLELRRFALEWGDTCEVVSPADLRAQVVAELRSALRQYDDDP